MILLFRLDLLLLPLKVNSNNNQALETEDSLTSSVEKCCLSLYKFFIFDYIEKLMKLDNYII